MSDNRKIRFEEMAYEILTKTLLQFYEDEFNGSQFDLEKFRAFIKTWMEHDKIGFYELIEYTLNGSYSHVFGEYINWHNFLKIYPHKFKKCINCGRIFYDNSRNGRKKICRLEPLNDQLIPKENNRHPNGMQKSACEMERHRNLERRRLNKKLRGIDSDEYRYKMNSDHHEWMKKELARVQKQEDTIAPVKKYNLGEMTLEEARKVGLEDEYKKFHGIS